MRCLSHSCLKWGRITARWHYGRLVGRISEHHRHWIPRSAEKVVAQTYTCSMPKLVPVPLSFRVMPQKGLHISPLITTALAESESSIMLAPESLYAMKLIRCWNNPALMASNALLIPQLTAFLPLFAFNGSRASFSLLHPVELAERFGD